MANDKEIISLTDVTMKMADAFHHHGYSWEEQDPYLNEYQISY